MSSFFINCYEYVFTYRYPFSFSIYGIKAQAGCIPVKGDYPFGVPARCLSSIFAENAAVSSIS